MPVTIRPATEADLPALLALYAELHPDDPVLAPPVAARAWRDIEAQAGRDVLLAESEAVTVGTVDCTTLPNLTRGGRPFMLVENVVVTASRRRSGIGAALLDAAVALARKAGCYKIQLLSRDTRLDAHAFYAARGFQTVAKGYRLYLD
jgi:N-acetylglutamate synthase-like GNAT family acetyltransferase